MSDYINALYQELLGRPVSEADMVAGKWAGHPESTVRTGIMNSAEYNARHPQSSSSSMSGFMHGFSSPSSSSSSALDGVLKSMYESQLQQSEFMFDQYKENQLPYEQDYWALAQQNLPAVSDQAVRMGEAQTSLGEHSAALGGLRLGEEQQLTGPRTDLALQGIGTQGRLLPYDEAAQRTGFQYQQGQNEMGTRLLPYQETASRTGSQFQTGMNEMGSRLLPFQEAASQSGLQFQNEQNAAGRYLLPQETQLTAADIQRQQALMPERQFAAHKFFQDANHGVNPEEWAARAGIDVGAAYAGADAALRRDAARMGVDPSSGRFAAAQGGYGLNMAKDLAQARTQGRRAGEDENWQRRVMAANYAK